jgi:DNA-binding MarR family transcriptional regulator
VTRLHDHIVARTCRLADAMTRMSARHFKERWNLRSTDLRLLNLLENASSMSVNEISRRALLDQAWVSRSLHALKTRRLVERRSDPNDTRLALFVLTERAREILEESRPYAVWSEKVLLNGVDGQHLKAMLDRVEANTQKLLVALRSFSSQNR